MLSIRLSTIALVVPFGAAVVFLLWFLWNLLHESGTVTFRVRSLFLRSTRPHSSARSRNSAAVFGQSSLSVRRVRQFDR